MKGGPRLPNNVTFFPSFKTLASHSQLDLSFYSSGLELLTRTGNVTLWAKKNNEIDYPIHHTHINMHVPSEWEVCSEISASVLRRNSGGAAVCLDTV